MTDEERRANPNPMDVAGALALVYTFGFIVTVALLLFRDIPAGNKDPLMQVLGLMSAIQMAIVAFYYGSSKSGEATQRAIEQRQGRSEAVVQEIAKATPQAPRVDSPGNPTKVADMTVTAKDVTVNEAPQQKETP